MDALNIINEMNRQLLAELEGEATRSVSVRSFFTDVNGDGQVTAADALEVIRFLNLQSLSVASGEQASVQSGILPSANTSSIGTSGSLADDAMMLLSNDSDVAMSGSNGSSATSGAVSDFINGSDDDEDDEDQVLSLLADDIAGLWG
jgi:hypothetical protein